MLSCLSSSCIFIAILLAISSPNSAALLKWRVSQNFGHYTHAVYLYSLDHVSTNRYCASGYFRGGPWWEGIELSELREPELCDPPEPPPGCDWGLFPPPVPPASLKTRSHSGPNLIVHVESAIDIASTNFCWSWLGLRAAIQYRQQNDTNTKSRIYRVEV